MQSNKTETVSHQNPNIFFQLDTFNDRQFVDVLLLGSADKITIHFEG